MLEQRQQIERQQWVIGEDFGRAGIDHEHGLRPKLCKAMSVNSR